MIEKFRRILKLNLQEAESKLLRNLSSLNITVLNFITTEQNITGAEVNTKYPDSLEKSWELSSARQTAWSLPRTDPGLR